MIEEPPILVPAIGAWDDRSVFYFGGCAPHHKNTFYAQVNNIDIYAVTLHVRFVDLEGEGTTDWLTYDMGLLSDGDWSTTLVGNDLKPMIRNYEFTRLEYQAIAWSVPNLVALRTEVQSVTFNICQD